jgi:NAD(P)-dependent dehydrogenase (short-subunit alcohol dehydrogenase family)
MDPPFSLSEDGFESQLAANYLGHFLLIKLLLPQVLKSETKRIVLVSSSGHGSGGVRWDDPNFGEGYDRKLA